MWDEIRERDGRVFGVLIQSCASCKSCPDSGGGVTLCADLPGLDPTVPQKIYFEMKMYAGYQHVCTVVYDEDGEYVATVYPAQGLRELPIMTVTSVVTMVNLIPSGIWR